MSCDKYIDTPLDTITLNTDNKMAKISILGGIMVRTLIYC
jgi:hypothetical protein